MWQKSKCVTSVLLLEILTKYCTVVLRFEGKWAYKEAVPKETAPGEAASDGLLALYPD